MYLSVMKCFIISSNWSRKRSHEKLYFWYSELAKLSDIMNCSVSELMILINSVSLFMLFAY